MSAPERLVCVGRVGRAHGRDGAFYVEAPEHPLEVGSQVRVADRPAEVERRAGSSERPIVRLSGVSDRGAALALRGEALLVPESQAPLGEGEWLAGDLVGCRVEGLGEVHAVVHGPSCDLLEVGERRVLVPLVRDAVLSVDLDARRIEVDHDFLALDNDAP